MSASILDLVNLWEPHPDHAGIYRFRFKQGVHGFAQEDGQVLHLIECGAERPGLPRLMAFFSRAIQIYPQVMVEIPFGKGLVEYLLMLGFCSCSIRKIDKPEWVKGMVWKQEQAVWVVQGRQPKPTKKQR